jgi:hypothetical protein
VYVGERDMGDMRDFFGEVSGRERRERGLLAVAEPHYD